MSVTKGNILVRSLSTSAAAGQLIKPPVQVFGLEGRYATALYSAATKSKSLDAVEKELTSFQQSIKTDAKLKEFIVNPTLKRTLKMDALKHLSTKASDTMSQYGVLNNEKLDILRRLRLDRPLISHFFADLVPITLQTKLSATTGNMLGLMAENGRLDKLEAVINAFKVMMAAHRGEVTCEVITADPLDQGQKQSLEAALKKFLKPNETLQLTTKVDPSLMGGMVVSIGDKYVDMSVATKVMKYTKLITTPV